MIHLQDLAEAEFAGYMAEMVEGYAQEIACNTGKTIEQARAQSTAECQALLPQGLATPNQALYTVVLDDKGMSRRIGTLWLEYDEAQQQGAIHDIFIDEAYRGQGWGKRTLELADEQMRARGIRKISLHVAADNVVARGLYEQQGYWTVRLAMQKKLDA